MNSGVENKASYDVCVFVGRFHPFHVGHMYVVSQALEAAENVVVFVGGANEPRSYRNPFSVEDRTTMIRAVFGNTPRLTILPLENSINDSDEWVSRVEKTVSLFWEGKTGNSSPRVALIGHIKDATSYYLEKFPKWGLIELPHHHELSATSIRESLFGTLDLIKSELDESVDACQPRLSSPKEVIQATKKQFTEAYKARYVELATEHAKAFLDREEMMVDDAVLAPTVVAFLREFMKSKDYQDLLLEYAYVARYQYEWRFAPYAPLFSTADCVAYHRGRVLMVKRNDYPGRGLWALPGGFVEYNETILSSALRELDEETGISLTPDQLRQSVVSKDVFDDPLRSSRGRTITHAFLFDVSSSPEPALVANDEETQDIEWKYVEDIQRAECFEDHYIVIVKMLKDAGYDHPALPKIRL